MTVAAGADTPSSVVAPVGEHNHSDDLVYHTHDADTSAAVNPVTKHTHTSVTGPVDVVYVHNHGATAPDTGVTQTEKHIHAVDNGKYAVYVGPVPNGSGSVTLTNTGLPELMQRPADDAYENLYLAYKGQNLRNVRLTFEAEGTMVKGAGIRISLPLDDANALPQFYPDNPSGPSGGVSLARLAFESLGTVYAV